MERDKQPVGPTVVTVEEEQGLVAVQALVLAVEAAVDQVVLAAEAVVDQVVLAAVDLAVNKKDVTNVTPSSYMN
jgi:hypothetical protein